MINKFAHVLTRKPKLVAIIAFLLLIPSLFGYMGTRINYDILSYLPQDADSAKGEKLLEDPFNMAATSMLVVEKMPQGYCNDLIKQIKDVDGVSNAIWVSNLIGIQIPTSLIPENFKDMFYKGDATMMIIQYDHPGASDETMGAIQKIRSICNKQCFLAGFSVVVKDTRDIMDKELPWFVGLAIVLALIAMMLTLESTVLPFVFILSIGLAVIYNFGTNIFLGQISYVTKAIAAVLQLGVTMDYSIFLYHRFVEERANYDDERDAMSAAIVQSFRSLSGSSLTTVAGFLALCFMRLTLGRDIGIVMAKGVILGIVTVICVLPSFVLIFNKQIEKHRHKSLLPSFDKLNTWILKRRKVISIVALLLFIPFIYAQNHANIYYKLDQTLPQDLPSIVANCKLKDDFDMATSHFILLKDDIKGSDLDSLEDEINDVDGITNIVSYNSILGSSVPEFFVPDEVKNILKQGGYQMIMVNSRYSTASDQVANQLTELNDIAKKYDPDALITGEAAMTDDLITTSNIDFTVTNYISIIAIFIIIAIMFKSISIPAVLVAAIELAISINQGIPYFTDAKIAFIVPTVIGCVQLGATVDYAILITTRFQEELRKGNDRLTAIKIAANSSDAAIITSSLVLLCATLGVSFITSIDLIGSICRMLARGAFISALISIFVIPSVLCVCEPIFNKTTLNWRTMPKEKKILKPKKLLTAKSTTKA